MLVGLIALTTLPVAQYPDVTPPTVTISGNFTGADAQTVEQTTTTAIETQVNGTPGMSYMSSNSTSSGQSSINVVFDIGTDVNIAALDVQNRVSVAEPALPDAVKRLGLTVRKRQPSYHDRFGTLLRQTERITLSLLVTMPTFTERCLTACKRCG